MNKAAIGIVEKLNAVESGAPDFLGDIDEGRCVTCWHRNPDGPEAAAIIMEMVEALEGIKAALLETGVTTNGLGGVCWLLPDKAVRELNDILHKVRGK